MTLYFWLFRQHCRRPSRRIFHLMGALAFLRSAEKHLKRRNMEMVKDQLKCVEWQLGIVENLKQKGEVKNGKYTHFRTSAR